MQKYEKVALEFFLDKQRCNLYKTCNTYPFQCEHPFQPTYILIKAKHIYENRLFSNLPNSRLCETYTRALKIKLN